MGDITKKVEKLTDNSGGSPSDTVAAIAGGGTACEDATKNAIASLAAKINQIIQVLEEHGILTTD